jgi:hypothetical protein
MRDTSFIVFGFMATLAMTATVEVVAAITRKPFYVIRNLRKLLFTDEDNSRKEFFFHAIATILHYAIGIGFAFCYHWLIRHDVIDLNIMWAIIYGMAIGIVGVTGWRISILLRKRSLVSDLSNYLLLIFSGHLVLAVVLFTLTVFFNS